MKKILFYTLMLCLSSFALTSCNDDNNELTDAKVTYYPTLEIQGAKFVEVPIGTTYTELGCKGVLRGEDCTSGIVTSGTVDVNTPGLYNINYTYTNEQGYKTSTQRTVAVCDPSITTDISGTYKTTADTYVNLVGIKNNYPIANNTIKITKKASGIFYISDFMGGLWNQTFGNGTACDMSGYIQLLADNSIVMLSSYCSAFDNGADEITNGKYDPTTGKISYEMSYENSYYNHEFFITLQK